MHFGDVLSTSNMFVSNTLQRFATKEPIQNGYVACRKAVVDKVSQNIIEKVAGLQQCMKP